MPYKAIFLDRDDTLIDDPGYINDPDQVRLLDGVPQALIELKAMGYKLVIISNQSAVARGIITEERLDEIHSRLKQLLVEKGTQVDGIYYSPYHVDGVVDKYRKASDCRKPNPGMLTTAAKELDIDLGQSWMIGDSARDVEAGFRAGCKTILLNSPSYKEKPVLNDIKPDYRAVNIKEAVNIIKQNERSPQKNGDSNESDTKKKQAEIMETTPQETKEITEPKSGSEHGISSNRIEQLLCDILEQLKRNHRTEMFGEFSTMRLLAGIVQGIVLFCLLICVWFLMSPERENKPIFIALGFTIVLQIMSLTFYTMQERK